MTQVTCPRCQRANPSEAVYCYFDGAELGTLGQSGLAAGTFLREFVFPSGRRCRTVEELVQGCQYEWEEARTLLHKGVFVQFMGGIGRMDLMAAAKEAQGLADQDIGLHTFLGALPITRIQGPRLELSPRRLHLGPLLAGETRSAQITIANSGPGLLQGKLKISEGAGWLNLGERDNKLEIPLKAARDQQILLQVTTRGLGAPCTCSGRLTVITNGGVAEVPVRLDLIAHPFPSSSFQGVSTPREMAERMKNQPKLAVPLLENGEMARWFALNGWEFPVKGNPAKGVAAVQQFFEGMGLSKPPAVVLSEKEIRLAGGVRAGQVLLRTSARKWVYGSAHSDVPWLRVTTPNVSGPQQATVAFEVDPSFVGEARTQEGQVRVVANAGQELSLRVVMEGRQLPSSPTVGWLQLLLAGAFLGVLYRILLAIPADLLGRVVAPQFDSLRAPGTFLAWLQAPVEVGFVRFFTLTTWWLGALIGGMAMKKRGGHWGDVLSGLVAGGVGGLLLSTTLACLLPALDWLPRTIWAGLRWLVPAEPFPGAVGVWTLTWVLLACACWGVLGGLVGLVLPMFGRGGSKILFFLGAPWFWLFRRLGWKQAVNLFMS